MCVKGVVARELNRGEVDLVVRGRRHRWGRQLRPFRFRIRDRGYVGAGRRAVSERRGVVCAGRRALSGPIGCETAAGMHISQWSLREAANEDAKPGWWDGISRCSPASELRPSPSGAAELLASCQVGAAGHDGTHAEKAGSGTGQQQ